MTINRKEALRYMGIRGEVTDEALNGMIDECISEVSDAAEPRHVLRCFELEITGDNIVRAGGISMPSANLSRNLRGCESVYFMAATLGNGIDRILSRYTRLWISKAAVFQAVAAAAIEGYCNDCQNELSAKLAGSGLYLRPRFSPGYGDLPLSVQQDFLGVLNASRTVGIVLSPGGVMIPEKSVTAVMGVGRDNTRCHIEGCESCSRTDCAYRR